MSGTLPLGFGDPALLPKDSRATVNRAVAGFCMGLGTIAVALRLYTRYFIVRRLGIDDAMAVLSLVFLMALGTAQILNVASGLGTHMYLIRGGPQAFTSFLRDLFFTVVFYNIALLFIKMTFLFQYYRVVAEVKRLRIVYIVAMVLIGGWTISQIFIVIFTCVPVHKFWDFNAKGYCVNNPAQAELNPDGNIITDFLILLLPLPVLVRLKLQRPQKFALIGIFCLGFITCIISILRRVYLMFDVKDITYSSAAVSAWSIAEVATGILCAALPTLRPLLGRYFPSLSGTLTKLSGYSKFKDSTTASTANSKLGLGSRNLSKGNVIETMTELGAPQHRRGDSRRDIESRPGTSHGAIPATNMPKSPPRTRENVGKAKMIGGKPTPISWPLEVSTNITGAKHRPDSGGPPPQPPPKDGWIRVNRELRVESSHLGSR